MQLKSLLRQWYGSGDTVTIYLEDVSGGQTEPLSLRIVAHVHPTIKRQEPVVEVVGG